MAELTSRILIVDDEKSILDSMGRFFKAMKYEIETALSGAEALTIMRRNPADIVITDIRMDEMDGLELLSILRKDYPGADVIIMSGHGEMKDAIEALRLGAFDYLCKPFDFEEMAIVMERALQRQEKERQMQHMQEQLYHSQKMESLGLLAGGVAHEFNNLMSGIMGYSDMALSSNDPEMTDKALRICIKSSRRAAEIARNLLRFARADKHRSAPLDINTMVNDTISLIRKDFDHANIKHNISIGITQTVKADVAQMRQAFLNLLVNARQALMEKSETDRRIDVKTWSDDENVYISVSDNGPGVPEEIKDKIFEPFFSTHGLLNREAETTSTGLGLSVVDGIVRSHGGEVLVTDREGGGACFTIKLPVAHDFADKVKRILICDDEDAIRRITRSILEKAGYEVAEAESGEQAMSLLHQELFDLMLTDQLMPGIGGVELIQRVNKLCPDMPVVMVTAVARHELAKEAIVAGARECVFKPVNTRKLIFIAEKYTRPTTRFGASLPPKVELRPEEKSILVIDADPVVRDIYNLTLSREGYRTTMAGSGREAINLTTDHYYDLIIIDPEIRDIAGQVAIHSLRANNPYTPIVLSTRSIDRSIIDDGLKAGACRVIEKPFQPLELIETITNLLAIYHDPGR